MPDSEVKFDDGDRYDRMMGVWSRLAGAPFLDWLSPPAGQRWIDVGCGNGAFTELLIDRCQPAKVLGVDPSPGLLDHARKRHAADTVAFAPGDAMALPAEDASFDAAAMALVIFFVPDPARGVAEMKRVVRAGGTVSAYVWDMLRPGGFPMEALQKELQRMGVSTMLPPRADMSSTAALQALWADAGLTDVATREIAVSREFLNFEDHWASMEIALAMAPMTRALTGDEVAALKNRLREQMPPHRMDRPTITARANAITGKV